MSDNDVFIINKIYPKASTVFSTEVKSVDSLSAECLFVLDTNALLIPYTTSSKSIEEIKKVYNKLIMQNRLYIPGQVAREFAKNRPEKIKELFSQIVKKLNIQSITSTQYPLLANLREYIELVEQESKINNLLKEYRSKVQMVMSEIKAWAWNDPVSKIYQEAFDEQIVYDPTLDEESVKKELKTRFLHKIPPGYKDQNKSDDGIGDLLIWLTIIELSKEKNKDIIFVSGDEKSDWFYRSENQSLYPRFELTIEFKEKCENHDFNIMRFSEFLEKFGVVEDVVVEVESKENLLSFLSDKTNKDFKAIAIDWLLQFYATWHMQFVPFAILDLVLINEKKEKIGVEIITESDIEVNINKFQHLNENNLLNEYREVLIIVVFTAVTEQELHKLS
jgi:hypothetical protein